MDTVGPLPPARVGTSSTFAPIRTLIRRLTGPRLDPNPQTLASVAPPHTAPVAPQTNNVIRAQTVPLAPPAWTPVTHVPRANTSPVLGTSGVVTATTFTSRQIDVASKHLRDAVRRNDLPGVLKALSEGASTTSRSMNGWSHYGRTALTVAASIPGLQGAIWDALLSRGQLNHAMGSSPVDGGLGARRQHHKDTALHQAVRHGNRDGMDRLLRAGASRTVTNAKLETPGHLAFARMHAMPGDADAEHMVLALMTLPEIIVAATAAHPPPTAETLRSLASRVADGALRNLTDEEVQQARPYLSERQLDIVEELHRAVMSENVERVFRLRSELHHRRFVRNAHGDTAADIAFRRFQDEPDNVNRQRIAVRLWTVVGFMNHVDRAAPAVPEAAIRSALSHVPYEGLLALPDDVLQRIEPYLAAELRSVRTQRDTLLHRAVRAGDLATMRRLVAGQADARANNREGVSAMRLAFDLYLANPDDAARRQMAVEVMDVPTLLDAVRQAGATLTPQMLETLFRSVPLARWRGLAEAQLAEARPHLTAAQVASIALGETDLHVAARQGTFDDILRLRAIRDEVDIADTQGRFPRDLVFERLVADPQNADVQRIVSGLIWLPQLMDLVDANGTLAADVVRAVVHAAPESSITALTVPDLNRFGLLLSAPQLAHGLTFNNASLKGWIEWLTPEQIDGLDDARFIAIRQHLVPQQIYNLLPSQRRLLTAEQQLSESAPIYNPGQGADANRVVGELRPPSYEDPPSSGGG